MGRIHVFAGPSLDAEDVARLLPGATVHPPVAAGDLLALDAGPADTVVVIDGLFLQTRSVRHKEVLVLLERGVEVWGCASMGALRGAELHPFGMRTSGLIERLFRLGVLTGDDEVTVLHTEASDGCRALSEALVNMRVSVRRQVRAGTVAAADAARVITAAAALPFGERRWERVLRDAGGAWARRELAALVRGAPAWRVDQKRADAVACLARLRTGSGRRLGMGSAPGPAVPRTIWLAAWERDAAVEGIAGVSVEEALTACRLLGVDYPELARDVALERVAAWSPAGRSAAVIEALAAGDGPGASAERRRVLCDAVRPVAAGHGLLDADVERRWLSPEEQALDADERLLRLVARTFWVPPGVPARAPLVERLAATGGLDAARDRVLRARDANRRLALRDDRFAPHRLDAGRVAAWYLTSWGAAEGGSPARALADRGFTTVGEVVAAGRSLYAWARTEGTLAEPLRLAREIAETAPRDAVTSMRFFHDPHTGS